MNNQTMNNRYFARCYMECTLGERSEAMVVTVSERGAQGVRFNTMPYSNISSLAGKIIAVRIGGKIEIKGKVYKESNLGGTSFSIEFTEMTSQKKDQIRGLIAKHQYPAPWARSTDRLPFNPRLKSVQIPKLAFVHEPLREIEMKVLNFSRDGLQLEVTGAHKAAWNLGECIVVDLYTNKKDEIKKIQGHVVRITEDIKLDTSETVYRYGIQLTDENEVALRKYTDMIETAESAYCDSSQIAAA